MNTLTTNIVFKRKVTRNGIDAMPESAEFLGKVDNGPLNWNLVIPNEADIILKANARRGNGDISDWERP